MRKIATGDMQLVRQINRAAILQIIREKGPISRVMLARLSKLTSATAFSIVEELTGMGLVKESGIGASAGGRKPMLFEFNPSAFAAVGVDLRANRLIATVTDLEAQPLAKIVHPYHGQVDGPEGARLISQAAQEAIHISGMPLDKLVGLGVSVPALIDSNSGLVVQAVNLSWEQVPLRELLREQLDIPIHIIDVSIALTVAETYFGSGRGVQNLICLNVGEGVGSGIVIGGQLYLGADGVAGEIGHTTVDEDGPRCRCGNYGCLERLVANPAIAERAIKGLKQGAISSIRDSVGGKLEEVGAQDVVKAAKLADGFAQSILIETGRYLGVGIANVVNFLNPEMVIVGGSLPQMAGELLLEPLREAVQYRSLTIPARRVRILPADLGIEASSIGAAAWAMIQAGFLAEQPWVPTEAKV